VGKLIVKAAAGNLKKVSLELGGKSPNIVLEDADMDTAIAGAANAVFFNHGQCCCAGSRLYVHKKKFDAVVDGVAAAAKKIKLGPGMAPDTQMGPLVSDEQLNRVLGYLDAGAREGAKAVAGGHRKGDRGYFVEPTVLAGLPATSRVLREEIFGPVAALLPAGSYEEAVALANDTPFGLGSYVYSNDAEQAARVADQIDAGMVYVNIVMADSPELPFGGVKRSGTSRELGLLAADEFVNKKLIRTAP
jgi:phenylacetaldehyde dehydrogenase